MFTPSGLEFHTPRMMQRLENWQKNESEKLNIKNEDSKKDDNEKQTVSLNKLQDTREKYRSPSLCSKSMTYHPFYLAACDPIYLDFLT